jgi:hypothetical protein
MPMRTELPGDLDPEELNAMIRDLALEKDLPQAVHPDLVEPDHIPGHIYGYNRGCNPDGLTLYREGQRWRRQLIVELARSPEWIAQWRERRELNRRIRKLCAAKDLQFRPWECAPWNAPDELPERDGQNDWIHIYGGTVPQAVQLRRRLIAELEAADAGHEG